MTTSVSLPFHGRMLTGRALLLLAVALAVVVAAAAVAVTLLVTRPTTAPAAPAGAVHFSVVDDGCPTAHPGQPC